MAKSNNKVRSESLDIYSALAVSHSNIESCLRQMKQPINQSKTSQDRLLKDLTTFITELYNNVKISIRANTIKDDPSGVLTNTTIYSTLERTKKELPHWHLVPAIIQNLIDNDQDPIMPKDNKAQSVTPQATQTPSQPPVQDPTPQEIVETIAQAQAASTEGLSELDIKEEVKETMDKQQTTAGQQITITPEVKTELTAAAQAIAHSTVAGATETVAIPLDPNDTFHIPYMMHIEELLLQMNDAFEEAELIKLRSQLGVKVREWVDAFYKSLHDIENPNRVTVDKVGILTATTKYSQPSLHAKFDNAHMVDKIIAKVNDKYKKTETEASVHAMATAISGAQDDSVKEFTVPTGNGEEVSVNKETKDVTAKKDGVVVRFFKGIYKGVKSFFSNIWKQMKRFGTWVKSWFSSNEDEKRIDVSPEEAKKMEEEAKLRAAELSKQKPALA